MRLTLTFFILTSLCYADTDFVWDKGWLNYIESSNNKQSPYSIMRCVTLVETLHHCVVSKASDNYLLYLEDVHYTSQSLDDYSMTRARLGYYPYIVTVKD
jgi:hypothetical protein